MLTFNDNLTPSTGAAILSALSPHVTVRNDSRKKKMPTARLIHRLRYHMQKIYGGRCLGRESVQGYLSLSVNPNNVHRQIFKRIKRCPLTFKREHIMSHSKFAQSVQNQGQNAPETQNIQFFMILNTVGRMTDAISPRFETKNQADEYLKSVIDRYENAFVGLYTSLTRNLEERARLASLIVKEGV